MWRASAQGQVDVWKWTGRNDYVALCETGYLSFGGGLVCHLISPSSFPLSALERH
jgi:hypothetical protein